MTFQQLEYLVSVYDHRHFGHAAVECKVSQPTLSTTIQKLEAELGVTLFERSSRTVKPTPICEKVVQQERQTLMAAEGIGQLIADAQRKPSGTFRLGILPTIAPYLLPRCFPKLCKDFPQLDLRVKEMKTQPIKEALLSGDIDAAVIVRTEDAEGLRLTPLFFEQFVAYVAPSHALYNLPAIKTSDLVNEAVWLLDEGHCFRDQLIKFCHLKSAEMSRRSYTLGSIETFMRMVEAGDGVTFIPELALFQLNSEQRKLVRPFAIPIPTREIVLATAPHFVRESVKDLLVERICGCVPERMKKLNNTETRV